MNQNVNALYEMISNLTGTDREKLMILISEHEKNVSYTGGARTNNPPYSILNPPSLTICKTGSFDAAHNNPNITGKCTELHGHTYKYEIYVRGLVDPNTGIVVDFRDVKKVLKDKVESIVDHKYLNEVLPFLTSCEHVAIWMFRTISEYFNVVKVVLWENETSFATVTDEDMRDYL